MVCDIFNRRLYDKLEYANNVYAKLIYKTLFPVSDALYLETKEHFRLPPEGEWKPMPLSPQWWGGEYQNIWVKTTVTVPKEAEGKKLFLVPHTGAVENLFFLDGKPRGIINSKNDFIGGMHSAQMITDNARAGDTYQIALECYAGHLDTGTQPYDHYGEDMMAQHETCCRRYYEGMNIAVRNDEVWGFVYDLKAALQMVRDLPDGTDLQAKAKRILEEVFTVLIQYPDDYPEEEWTASVAESRRLMAPLFEKTDCDAAFNGKIALIGHSHMDSAWVWPMAETVRKCARTYSNVLRLMEQYPEYTFVQSSALHLEWMRLYYPDIFEGIRQRVAEGRYEPNGGVWVECDGNIPSGESFIRQFLKGQLYTRKYFGYTGDTFWLCDTFGYSAAIPQLMRGACLKNFCTTKISWNEVNAYPHDLFTWRGIDGSGVLTHFHNHFVFPDISTVRSEMLNIRHKEVYNGKLLPFGYGDGGGGPTPGMLEDARRMKGLPGMPKAECTTVSAFMKDAAENAKDLPEFFGELYLEKHRGVLTQNHDIKNVNRRLEYALRDMEYMNVLAGEPMHKKTDGFYRTVLANQAHDIISGTSLDEVHRVALKEGRDILSESAGIVKEYASSFTDGSPDSITVFNTLSFGRDDLLCLENTGGGVEGCPSQEVTDLCGRRTLLVRTPESEGFSAVSYKLTGEKYTAPSPFRYENNRLETPHLSVTFDEAGYITSLIVRKDGRELRRPGGEPLNTFYAGESVPHEWDSYDLDYAVRLKMKPQRKLLSREVAADGALCFIIRSAYAVGKRSTLTQDMIFYADSARVDFHTFVDWKDKRTSLKVGFDLNLLASSMRNEIQFGFLDRATTENTYTDIARFEVCNHKWTDISEGRFGVALLNDCKYGISAHNSELRLSLEQGGAHPDITAGAGRHEFTYSLLPHDGPMDVNNVTKPAYMLNVKPVTVPGTLKEPMTPFVGISSDHVICEAVKCAELVPDAAVLRFYEAERSAAICQITVPAGYKRAFSVNMIEDIEKELPVANGKITLHFSPFSIHTVMFTK